jgi:hypothetical protein
MNKIPPTIIITEILIWIRNSNTFRKLKRKISIIVEKNVHKIDTILHDFILIKIGKSKIRDIPKNDNQNKNSLFKKAF